MTVFKPIEEYIFTDALEFVKEFEVEDIFKDIYDMDVKNWKPNVNLYVSDQMIVEEILEVLDDMYFVYPDPRNTGYIRVVKLE